MIVRRFIIQEIEENLPSYEREERTAVEFEKDVNVGSYRQN